MDKNAIAKSIDKGIGQFEAETSIVVDLYSTYLLIRRNSTKS